MRLTVFISALISAAVYLGWLPEGGDPMAPMALATGALITLSTIYGLAKG